MTSLTISLTTSRMTLLILTLYYDVTNPLLYYLCMYRCTEQANLENKYLVDAGGGSGGSSKNRPTVSEIPLPLDLAQLRGSDGEEAPGYVRELPGYVRELPGYVRELPGYEDISAGV